MYRIVSPTAILGYGFPEKSLKKAALEPINLIACDAGSMDAGPYYLGSGKIYVEKTAIKRDLSLILDVALAHKCPVIIGNAGFAGDIGHLDSFLEIAKSLFCEKNIADTLVAVVDSHIDTKLLLEFCDGFKPLGKMPPLNLEKVKNSSAVAQMGIAPFITALNAGAQFIFAGRACDVAIFAAGPIRNGFDSGLAYHAGHILECGAIACSPGSGSDCLIAEFLDDNKTVLFSSANQERITTAKSIAAHSLYEESHPSLQYYPEGILDLRQTHYFQHTPEIAGIRNSKFIHKVPSIKIEGAAKVGVRIISLLPCIIDTPISSEYIIYGKNGVEVLPVTDDENEMAIIVAVSGQDKEIVETLSSILKAGLLHFGYPGRRTTAGNLAYPMSPSTIIFSTKADNELHAIFIGGSREPEFIRSISDIFKQILQRVEHDYPDLLKQCKANLHVFDKHSPLAFVDSVANNYQEVLEKHNAVMASLESYANKATTTSYLSLDAGELYDWSIFHISENPDFINNLFPILLYRANKDSWILTDELKTQSVDIGIKDIDLPDEHNIDLITFQKHLQNPVILRNLTDMAAIIRTKDAGVNTLTYDIFFNTLDDYKQAIISNIFTKDSLATILQIPLSEIIGAFKADSCLAIKISRYRRVVSGSVGTRDVFGAQQHMPITKLKIPIYSYR